MLKKLFILMALAAGLALAGLVGLFLWLKSWLTPEYLRAEADKALATAYKGKVGYEEVALAFPGSVSVRRISVADPTGKTRYLATEGLSVGLDPWALLEKKVRVTGIRVDGPEIDLVLAADGHLEMLDHVPKPAQPADPAKPIPLDWLLVEDVRITGGRVRVLQGGAVLAEAGPIEIAGRLVGPRLEVRSLTSPALETLKLSAKGAVVGLDGAPKLEGFVVEVAGEVPPSRVPASAGKLSLPLAIAMTLDGPPAALVGKGTLGGGKGRWTPPDPQLPPLEIGALQGELALKGTKVRAEKLSLGIFGGTISGAASLDPAAPAIELKANGLKVGAWIGPALTARGFGAPLPALTVDVEAIGLTAKGIGLTGTRIVAGGLAVSGDMGLDLPPPVPAGKTPAPIRFRAGTKLAGTFEGADLATALALPGIALQGPLSVAMTLAGDALSPKVDGTAGAPRLEIRRPGGMRVETTNLTAKFAFDDGILDVPQLALDVFGGKVNATAQARLKDVPPSYKLAITGAKLGLPAMLKDVAQVAGLDTGTADLSLDLAGKGFDAKGVSGGGKLSLLGMKITTSPTLGMVAQQLGMPSLASPVMHVKTGSLTVKDGRMDMGKLEGDAGVLGPLAGTLSLGLDSTLAGKGTWNVKVASTTIPALNGKTVPVPLELGGTLMAPKLVPPDLGKLAGEAVKAEAKARADAELAKQQAKLGAKVDEKLGGMLGKLLGGKGAPPAPASTAPAAATTGSASVAPAPATTAPGSLEGQLKNEAKNLLKGLFR